MFYVSIKSSFIVNDVKEKVGSGVLLVRRIRYTHTYCTGPSNLFYNEYFKKDKKVF